MVISLAAKLAELETKPVPRQTDGRNRAVRCQREIKSREKNEVFFFLFLLALSGVRISPVFETQAAALDRIPR